MKKLNEAAYNVHAGDSWPSYDDYLNDIGISDAVRLELDPLEANHKKINLGYDYLSLAPMYGDIEKMTDDQKYKLTKSKTF